jgi:hypothetical protein
LEFRADVIRWVKTENGQIFADAIGVQEPPMSLEESVSGVLKQVSCPVWIELIVADRGID